MKSSALRSFARVRTAASLSLSILLFGISLVAVAATLDYYGPPPAGDPSAWTGPIVSESLAGDLADQPPVYKGAIEGGPTGSAADQGVTGSIPEDDQRMKEVGCAGLILKPFGSEEFLKIVSSLLS